MRTICSIPVRDISRAETTWSELGKPSRALKEWTKQINEKK
ncbi:MAG: hypothetical protein WD381_01470 [Balneolaceae bacterium]